MRSAQPYAKAAVQRASRVFFSTPLLFLHGRLSTSKGEGKNKIIKSRNPEDRGPIFDRLEQNIFLIYLSIAMGAAMVNGAMMIRRRLRPRVPFVVLLSCTILLSCLPVLISAAVVTLDSMEIFKTHEWLPSKPTVYFNCKGEDKIILPDVKEKNVMYNFKGEESWQPLTELRDKKCKRCGFYEKDAIKTNVFDDWEFCPSDFTRSDGKYFHFKDREFNATFLCPECVHLGQADHFSEVKIDSKQLHWAIIAAITILVAAVFIAGLVSAYKCLQKRKRQQQQARFLKLFEETDDVEDELGIGPLSHTF